MPNNFFPIVFKYAGGYLAVSFLIGIFNMLLLPSLLSVGSYSLLAVLVGIMSLSIYVIFGLAVGYGLRELLRENNYKLPIGSVFSFGFAMAAIPVLVSPILYYFQTLFAGIENNHVTPTNFLQSMVIGFIVFFAFTLFIISFVGRWLMYKKAGEKGWHSIVPILHILTLIKIAKKDSSMIFLLFIPLVNFFVYYQLIGSISFAFKKSSGFTAGLFFLPFIFYPILGFGDAKYRYGDFEYANGDIELNLEDHLVDGFGNNE